MDDLIKRLEAATGPSRELDADIFCAVNPGYAVYLAEDGTRECMKPGEYGPVVAPHYSSSIDAALTLVPDELDWLVRSPTMASVKYKSKCFANVIRECAEDIKHNEGWHETAAIALCIAALKARP